MPHMMPMLWLFMLLSTLMMLFLMISMIYFLYLPSKKSCSMISNKIISIKWNWEW